MPVGTVVVPHQVGWRCCPGKGLRDLSGQPLSRRVSCHLEPQQLPPAVAQHQKREQSLKRQGRNHKQVNGRDRRRVVAEECLPALPTAIHPEPCMSRPSTARPQSRASTARHGSEMLPTLGFPCSSVGSDRATRERSLAALPASAISSARTP